MNRMNPVGMVALCLAVATLACQDRAGPPAQDSAPAQGVTVYYH